MDGNHDGADDSVEYPELGVAPLVGGRGRLWRDPVQEADRHERAAHERRGWRPLAEEEGGEEDRQGEDEASSDLKAQDGGESREETRSAPAGRLPVRLRSVTVHT